MPDKIVTRENRDTHTDNNLLIGIGLAAVIALLLLFGARYFSNETVVTPPASTQAPATGNTAPQQ